MNSLFKPVVEQKVPPGVDPKSVLCAFFKKGQCTKGKNDGVCVCLFMSMSWWWFQENS